MSSLTVFLAALQAQSLGAEAPPQHTKTRCRIAQSVLLRAQRKSKRLHTQARKRSINPNVSVRISSGGVRVFHMKGGEGTKTLYAPRNPGKPNLWAGCPRILPRYLKDAYEKFEGKQFCSTYTSSLKDSSFT